MSKRVPSHQLNHDNWDQEEEKEDPGVFSAASDQELKGRIIKKARRTFNAGDASDGGTPSPFKAFSGFSSKSSFHAPNFSFISQSAKTESETTKKQESGNSQNGCSESTAEVKHLASEAAETPAEEKPTFSGATTQPSTSGSQDQDIQYFKMLRNLNESVLKWIQLHFSKNPCCNFCPVFNDYKNYVHQLEIKYLNPGKTGNQSSSLGNTGSSFKMPDDSGWMRTSQSKSDFFKFDTSNKSQTLQERKREDEMKYGAGFPSNTTNTSTFSFGIKSYPTATSGSKSEASTPKTSEKSKGEEEKDSEPTPKAQPFSFGLKTKSSGEESATFDKSLVQNTDKKLFTFEYNSSSPAKPAVNPDTAENVEKEDYVPPKNEVSPIAEEGAVYTKRCKLFFQKNNEYVEKGVGMLYLKPIDNKTQLLIRADTTLGNILLNIALSAALPMQRTGKNNVLIVCIPNPPLDPDKKSSEDDVKKAVPLLIRVKTSEDADELLETLNKYKS